MDYWGIGGGGAKGMLAPRPKLSGGGAAPHPHPPLPTPMTFRPRDSCYHQALHFGFALTALYAYPRERTSGFEPSCKTFAPRYLTAASVSKFFPLTFISLWMLLAVPQLLSLPPMLTFPSCFLERENVEEGG